MTLSIVDLEHCIVFLRQAHFAVILPLFTQVVTFYHSLFLFSPIHKCHFFVKFNFVFQFRVSPPVRYRGVTTIYGRIHLHNSENQKTIIYLLMQSSLMMKSGGLTASSV